MSAALANPVEMIERGAPRIIHNAPELEQYTEALFNLTALENPTPPQQEAIELLTLLVECYEHTHYPIPVAGAVSVVKFLIEAHLEAGSEPECTVQASCRYLHLVKTRTLAIVHPVPGNTRAHRV
jgi:hypothetical protein